MQQVQPSGPPALHVNFSLHGKKNMAETKINTLADVAALRATEPESEGQVILLRGTADRVLFYVYKAGDNTADDGTLTVVTQAGKRWRLVRDGNTLELVWFKTVNNSWDQAMETLLHHASTINGNAAKIVFPRGTVNFKKPIVLDYSKDWFLEGQGGHGASGTVLDFNIPRSAGYGDYGAIHCWGEPFGFQQLTLRNLMVQGIGTSIVDPTQDEKGRAYCHGVYCRTTATMWEDVAIQNFRGSALYLDNAFDNNFNRVSVFASGRMKDGYSYTNLDDVANPDATAYPPLLIMSTRPGDQSNFNRFFDGSIELNNVTPFVEVRGGIQMHFTRMHAERPGGGDAEGHWPLGTFIKVGGEIWLTECGISNFTRAVSYGPYAQMVINGCHRLSGDIYPYDTTTIGNGRIKLDNTLCSGLYISGNIQGDYQISNSVLNYLRTVVISGSTLVTNCRINGDVTIAAAAGTPLGSAGGVKISNSQITGSLIAGTTAQRVSVAGCHIFGDLTLPGANCSAVHNVVIGKESIAATGNNISIGKTSPAIIYVDNSYTEISGTIQKGALILKREALANQSPGWVCTFSGAQGSGLKVAPLATLGAEV
ncbi:hypothetical protein ACUTSW_02410 [Serratia sp. TSA_198.1]|uniref:hypothetical protein n=1 Tax=Serratia sp. TSA_198.1 TaxID=3415664 RepID=UPI0040452102